MVARPSGRCHLQLGPALDVYVRTRLDYELNPTQRKALKLLSDYGEAAVARSATGPTDDRLVIHAETALVLVRQGYADAGEGGGISVNQAGLRKSGKVRETAAERRRRTMAASLEAQEAGVWKPAPAGASFAAQSDEVAERHEWGEANRELNDARHQLNFELHVLELAKSWSLTSTGELGQQLRDVENARSRVRDAEKEVERLRRRREQQGIVS